ncbi:MAG: EamA family transporter RarD [Clostridiales bacterium]|nr:EamA family transporter RarD [Candidatus Crickella merdequi]
MNITRDEYKKGLVALISTLLMWGFLPIYWQMLVPISSWVIIIYRILTVFLYSLVVARTKYTFGEIFGPLKDRKTLVTFFFSGLVITANWSIFIYAVNANHVVQTATGYYIEPLVICLIGNIVFKEKFTKYNLTAIIIAAVAVVILLIHFGEMPTIALLLAFTFGLYSAIKKSVSQPPILSMVYETMFLAPLALVAILYLEGTGQGALAVGDMGKYCLMLLCGLLTLIPLTLFAYAAQRVPMFHLGMGEFVAPTITLILGITVLGESIDMTETICFLIIWFGLAIFTVGEYKTYKKEYTAGE